MIRKISNSILVLILLITSTGITYHYHYCSGTLMAFSIFHTPEPCCENPDQCCDDKSVTLQFKVDYVFSADYPDLTDYFVVQPSEFADAEVFTPPIIDLSKEYPEESPPPTVSLRLSILQQYLI